VRSVDWTGMFDGFGIWDLDGLTAAYDIDWTTGLDAEFILSVPEECVLTSKEGRGLLNGGPNLWAAWDAKCPDVLDLAGNTGLLFCDQQHQAQLEAYAIYSNVRRGRSPRAVARRCRFCRPTTRRCR